MRRRWLREARGRGTAAAAVAGVTLFTAACGPTTAAGGGQGAASSSAQPSGAASPPAGASPAPTSVTFSSPAGGGSAGGGSAGGGQAGGGSATCTVGMLKATLDAGPSGAGTIGLDLIFTNTSGQACVLDGNPGVKLVGAPSSDQWDVKTGLKPVTLRPGGKAYSVITYHDTGGQCETQATGMLVTPPGSYSSISLPFQGRSPVCENGALEVQNPVAPGAGPDLGSG